MLKLIFLFDLRSSIVGGGASIPKRVSAKKMIVITKMSLVIGISDNSRNENSLPVTSLINLDGGTRRSR